MDRLRIGVIGLGWFGEIHAETIAGVPNLDLAALCTRTPDRLAAMGEKFGVKKLYRDYNELLADPDVDDLSARHVHAIRRLAIRAIQFHSLHLNFAFAYHVGVALDLAGGA